MGFIRSLLSRKLFGAAIIYIGLLLFSSVYRSNLPDAKIPDTRKKVFVNAVNNGATLPEKILITYKDFNLNIKTQTTPVILLHGSPGSAGAFDGLAKHIKNRRLIAVDLPGFGYSEKDIPDYSIYAHSKYVSQLMDELKISKAHFVGFSLGGGVVLHIAEETPDKVESISFIASIGVQEYELLGNYYANHIVHGAQLGLFWVLTELIPHFGIFDGSIPYARNFYDTDQRPLRKILKNFDKPFQILHGKDDPLVPIEAAREHARLVPQSEFHEMDDDHFFVFLNPRKIEKTLQEFWSRVESGDAKSRKTADSDRTNNSKNPFNSKILKAIGPTAFVFIILLAGLAFLSEDFVFVLAGFFVAQKRFGFGLAITSVIIGSVLCILLSMLAGRVLNQQKPDRDLKDTLDLRSIFSRQFFSFRFLKYFFLGKLSDKFWRHMFSYSISSAIWAMVVVGLSYAITIILKETNIINLNITAPFLVALLSILVVLNALRVFNWRLQKNSG